MARYYDGYDWDVDGFPGEYVYGDHGYVDDYYMDERWKPIYYAPGYWVSNKARVYSAISESFIYGSPLRSGHIGVSLQINGKRVHKYLHRLVAEAFVPNPNNCPEVRHLDDDPSNNEVWNLEWGDQYDNVQDSIRNGHFRYFTRDDIERANASRRTPVVAVHLKSGKKMFFESQNEAARQLGVSQSSVHDIIYGRKRSCNGYYFAFQKEFDNTFDHTKYSYKQLGLPIQAVNITTGEVRVYSNARQASCDLGISEGGISLVLNGKSRYMKGWTFEYLNTEDEYDE